uniref:Putative salivary secreted protein n=1 Tax=Ornithodoros parkeri TaxID=140564 RepID=A6N9S2_ORNPR|nr:putative salivary secreted protein [Ornithodoros parkeri]
MKLLLIATLSVLIVVVQSCGNDHSQANPEEDSFGGRRRECDATRCSNTPQCGEDCVCKPSPSNALQSRCQLTRPK